MQNRIFHCRQSKHMKKYDKTAKAILDSRVDDFVEKDGGKATWR